MLTRFAFLMLAVVFAAGCGIKAETYVMTKDRVGITSNGGNAGYLSGTPQFQEPLKKTRKVYVLEVSRPLPESEIKKIEQTVTTTTTTENGEESSVVRETTTHESRLHIPVIGDEPASRGEEVRFSGPKEALSYTVEKDDTLQKIAKKFYGNYSKWVKIYDANKENLKNPNFVKPGTVLTIPAGE